MVTDMVIDAFLFAGELDILEIRLHELDSVVDHFVIVESCEPHGAAGRRQPTYLADPERWEEVTGPFHNKICYDVLDNLEPAYTTSRSGWIRENYHRSALMQPIKQLSGSPYDVVIISDVDEIPRASVLTCCIPELGDNLAYLDLDLYRYNVNTFDDEFWASSYVTTIGTLEKVGGPQPPRGCLDKQARLSRLVAPNAGWHFTSFMDLPRLREKLRSFAHSSDFPELLTMSDRQLAEMILAPRNIFTGRQLEKRRSDDSRLPQYFLDNREKFKNLTSAPLEEQYPLESSVG